MKLLDEFKEFLIRGNLVQIAVGIVIGLAFTALVNAFVEDLITPLIAAIGGQRDFSALDFTINDSTFRYGHFINALIAFIMIAAVVFFFVVKPVNMLISRTRREPPLDPAERKCPECLSVIPVEARRCSFCTAVVTPS
jgi:large conductance mechanosensitive channel